MRSQPVPLIAIFLVAVCVLTTLNSLVQSRFISLPFQLKYLFSHVPFLMALFVWMASRRGKVSWMTWVVPTVLVILTLTIEAIGVAFVRMPENPFVFLTQMKFARYVWDVLKPHIYAIILFFFLLRLLSLHLHPLETGACPPRKISIRLMFGLMIVVAICLTLDARFRILEGPHSPTSLRGQFLFWGVYLIRLRPALVWVSIAWLFVASNSRRWIGWCGLTLAFAWLGVSLLVFLPLLEEQYWYGRWPDMIALLKTDLLAFLCLYGMHLAGFRWDVRREGPSMKQSEVGDA